MRINYSFLTVVYGDSDQLTDSITTSQEIKKVNINKILMQ